MVSDSWALEWPEVRRRMEEARAPFTARCEPLLWYFGPATEFCKRVVGDGRSPANGERPQDHIASATAIHAFRSAVGSAELAVAGYADIAVTLNRSLWEMQLRLFSVREGGLLAALASLHYEAEQRIAAAEYELTIASGGRHSANAYLAQWVKWRDELRTRAANSGWDIKLLRQKGKLILATAAAEAKQSGSYKTLYLRHSLAAHATGSGTIYANLSAHVQEEGGVLLPLDVNVVDTVGDALNQLFLCLICAAEIVEDEKLADDIHHAFHHLHDRWLTLSPHLRS